MSAQEVAITKLDHDLLKVVTYPGVQVFADDAQVVVRTVWRDPPWRQGRLTLDTGGIMMERYYPGRWFNVMDLYSPTGVLLGWYCNVTRPAEIAPATIDWSDLALDLLVLPTGEALELDRDEFEELALPEAERQQAEQALATLQAWARDRCPPFAR